MGEVGAVKTSSDRDRVCLSLPPACCRGLPIFAGCSSQHQLEFPELCLGYPPECGGHSPPHVGLATISWVSGVKQNPSVAGGHAAPCMLPIFQQAPSGTSRLITHVYPCPGTPASASCPQLAKDRFRRGHPPVITDTSVQLGFPLNDGGLGKCPERKPTSQQAAFSPAVILPPTPRLLAQSK